MSAPQLSANQILLGNRVLSTQPDGLYLDGVKVTGATNFSLFDNANPPELSLSTNNRILYGIDGATAKLSWINSPLGYGVYIPLGAEFGGSAYIDNNGNVQFNSLTLKTSGTSTTITATGATNIDINLIPVGAGKVRIGPNSPGYIDLSNGGGSIDLTQYGSIQFGYTLHRTTLVGSVTTGSKTITLPAYTGQLALEFPTANIGATQEVYIAFRTDGIPGLGTKMNPFDGSTQSKFDTIFANLPTNIIINIGAGTFLTNGNNLKEGWRIHGAGKDITILQFPNNYAQPGNNYYFFITSGALNYLEITDLTTDCNRLNQPLYTVSTTIASGVTGVSLPQSTINVVSTTGFPSSGSICIFADNNYSNLINYTGTTSTSFTGCTGGSGTTITTGDYVGASGSLNSCEIEVKQGKYKNIKVLNVWANPGEGFPLHIEHDGSINEPDLLEIDGCEVLDPEGGMTCISAFDQRGGVCTCVIKNCLVQTTPLRPPHLGRCIIAWGVRPISAIGGYQSIGGTPNYSVPVTGGVGKVLNNRAIGMCLGLNHDTWDNNNYEIAGNYIEAYPDSTGYGGGAITFASPSPSLQQNINIHNNYFYSSSTGGNTVTISQPIKNLLFHNNTVVSDSTFYPAIAMSSLTVGIVNENIVKEAVGSTLSFGGLLVRDNIDINGNSIYNTSAVRGLLNQVWIALRTDGRSGRGTLDDPFDGSTTTKVSTILNSLPTNTSIHFGPGTFTFLPDYPLKTGWKIQGEGMYETVLQLDSASNLSSIDYGITVLTSLYNGHTDNVEIKDLTIDANWLNVAASTQAGLGANTATGHIFSGKPTIVMGADIIYQITANGGVGFLPGDISRTVSGTGIPSNTTILRIPTTTISTSSDSVTLPQSTINVSSTADFATPSSGSFTFYIINSTGDLQVISYTGISGNAFTGCTGGTGTIFATNPVTTLCQAVMSNNATATNPSASITIGGEKNLKLGAVEFVGSNNLLERVRCTNTYGSGSNGQENFTVIFSAPSGTDLGTSNGAINNVIRNCLIDNPYGNYGDPIAMFGSDLRPMYNSKVVGNVIKGFNNGLVSGFTSGGVNMAGVKNMEISGNHFENCMIAYIDTAGFDGLWILNNTSIKGSGGISLQVQSGSLKQNCRIENNYIHIQNRDPHYGTYALSCDNIAVTNCILKNNFFSITDDGLGENFQMRVFYGTGFINSEFSDNFLDQDGNGTLINTLTNVRVFNNRTLSTGKTWSNPDGGLSLADNVGFELQSNKGLANGYAPLDNTAKVPLVNLPSSIGGTTLTTPYSPLIRPNNNTTLDTNEPWRIFQELDFGLNSTLTFSINSEITIV